MDSIMKAADIFKQVEFELNNVSQKKQPPDLNKQNKIADSLLECMKSSLLEGDKKTLQTAYELADKLFRKAEYGFANDAKKYQSAAAYYFAKKVDFYKLSTELKELE